MTLNEIRKRLDLAIKCTPPGEWSTFSFREVRKLREALGEMESCMRRRKSDRAQCCRDKGHDGPCGAWI